MSNALFENVYNPDVLSCLANLSNDEVFTPPDVVNKMLDMLPQELFRNPDTTFLDPACKTGVFLREIAKRLIIGLEVQIPDLQERVDHIFQKQLYGIAITELTSLLSRRGVYCSKYPNSEFSVSRFDDAQGNIRYKRIPHTWGKTTYDSNGKLKASCIWCGASKSEYDRSAELETHAYEWIHTQNPEEIFKMKFDVIIGNPPYQLSDGGNNASATPIYHKFVLQSKKLAPSYLVMITPSRWFNGGRGLDEFRQVMLTDRRISIIHDYLDSSELFPGVSIAGGCSFFLWDKKHDGKCEIHVHGKDTTDVCIRELLEPCCDSYIRYNQAITILHKVRALHEPILGKYVFGGRYFGFHTRIIWLNNEDGEIQTADGKSSIKVSKHISEQTQIKIYSHGGICYIAKNNIPKGLDTIDKYKVIIPRTGNPDGMILGTPKICEPGSCISNSFVMFLPENKLSKEEAQNVISFLSTKFCRLLISLKSSTQDKAPRVYEFVPMQDFSKPWTDAELYTKYNLTQEEIDFIESMIKPMDSTNIKED